MAFLFLIVTLVTIGISGLSCYGGGCARSSTASVVVLVVWLVHFCITWASVRDLPEIEGRLTRAVNIVFLLPSVAFIVASLLMLMAALAAGLGWRP